MGNTATIDTNYPNLDNTNSANSHIDNINKDQALLQKLREMNKKEIVLKHIDSNNVRLDRKVSVKINENNGIYSIDLLETKTIDFTDTTTYNRNNELYTKDKGLDTHETVQISRTEFLQQEKRGITPKLIEHLHSILQAEAKGNILGYLKSELWKILS